MSHDLNFLERAEPEPVRRRHSRRRIRATLLFAVLAVAALSVVWTCVMTGRVVASALDGRDALNAAQGDALALDFDGAREHLISAQEHFGNAEEGLAMLWYLKPVPWVGAQLAASATMVTVGGDVIEALIEVVDLGADMLRLSGYTELVGTLGQGVDPGLTFESLPSDVKRLVLSRLAAAAPDMAVAETKIRLAIEDLDAMPEDGIVAPLIAALAPVRAQLVELQDALYTLSVAAVVLPEIGGLTEEKHFLLLFLNNTELRPGGGFIGAYGILGMQDGDISELETKDVYTLDNAAEPLLSTMPPEPLRAYNGAGKWFLRDSNWSPDFAVASQDAIKLFQQEVLTVPVGQRNAVQTPVTIDGVIAFTPTFASELLAITGPITVGGQTFTAENIPESIEYEVEIHFDEAGIPVAQRKELLRDLVNEMKSRLYSLSISSSKSLLTAFEDGVREKQLVLYSGSSEVEEVLTRMGWGGRMIPETPDVLLVADANLASLKSDPVVNRTVTYTVEPTAEGDYVGQVTIRYDHAGSFSWNTTRYRTYTRVYVPSGSLLLESSGALRNDKLHDPSQQEGQVDVGTDLGFTVFGAFTSVEPGSSRELTFRYLLPKAVTDAVAGGAYDLTVLKQIGAFERGLTLDLKFDKNVTGATVAEDPDEWGDNRYRLNTSLDQDRSFHVQF